MVSGDCPEFSVDDIREKLAPQLQDSVGADEASSSCRGYIRAMDFLLPGLSDGNDGGICGCKKRKREERQTDEERYPFLWIQ